MTLDSLLESLKNLGPGRLIMMLATFFGLIIFFVFIAVRSSAPSLSLLYSDLSTADATEIAAKLDNSNVPYALSEDGTKVSVPHKACPAKARWATSCSTRNRPSAKPASR
jgi:flagellar M-ring protein FliF